VRYHYCDTRPNSADHTPTSASFFTSHAGCVANRQPPSRPTAGLDIGCVTIRQPPTSRAGTPNIRQHVAEPSSAIRSTGSTHISTRGISQPGPFCRLALGGCCLPCEIRVPADSDALHLHRTVRFAPPSVCANPTIPRPSKAPGLPVKRIPFALSLHHSTAFQSTWPPCQMHFIRPKPTLFHGIPKHLASLSNAFHSP
jgi:hypothetical protein